MQTISFVSYTNTTFLVKYKYHSFYAYLIFPYCTFSSPNSSLPNRYTHSLAKIQISIPLQWSISCWMICAGQPVKVLIRV